METKVEPQLPPRTDAILHCELDADERHVRRVEMLLAGTEEPDEPKAAAG